MLMRKEEFRASKAMEHRVENTPNIEVLFNTNLRNDRPNIGEAFTCGS